MVLILETGLELDEFSFESKPNRGDQDPFCLLYIWRPDDIENSTCSEVRLFLKRALLRNPLQSNADGPFFNCGAEIGNRREDLANLCQRWR